MVYDRINGIYTQPPPPPPKRNRQRKWRCGERESKDGENEKVKMGRKRKWRWGEWESEDVEKEKVKMGRKRKQRWGEWESKDGEKEKVKMGRMRKWRCGERESEDGEKERVKKLRNWTMRRKRSGRASDRLCLTVVRTRDRTPISEYCQDERDVRVQWGRAWRTRPVGRATCGTPPFLTQLCGTPISEHCQDERDVRVQWVIVAHL